MELGFRIGPFVPEDACPIGYVKSPSISPNNTIILYDFSGAHIDNISTYPDQSKVLRGAERGSVTSIGPLYSSKFRLTNRVYARRDAKRSLPLFQYHELKLYLVSTSAKTDVLNQKIINYRTLFSDITILDKDDLVANDLIYDIEFEPAGYTDAPDNVFKAKIFIQGKKGDKYYKLRYRGLDRATGLEASGHIEVMSPRPVYELFNINLEFKDGYGADLLGQNYPDSRKSPKNKYIDANNGGFPWDADASIRKNGQYSLRYNYNSNSYECNLTTSFEQAAPMMILYNNTSPENDPFISSSNGYISLAVSAGSKVYNISYIGRSTRQVVEEINETVPSINAVEVLRIESLSSTDINVYRPTKLTSDGGYSLISTKYVCYYPGESRIKLEPPYDSNVEKPWYPRITMGAFVDTESPDKTPYYVNQYFSQAWSSAFGSPWKDVSGEVPTLVTSRIIKAKRVPIHNEMRSISLYDTSGRIRSSYIESIDASAGLIFLNTDINTRDYYISYTYKENSLEIVDLNLNPAHPYLADQNGFHHVYLRPFIKDGVKQDAPIYHINRRSIQMPQPGEEDILLGVYRIVDQGSKDQYQFRKTPVIGGGLRADMSDSDLKKKFSEIDFSTDIGFYDGIAYPGNAVVSINLPSAMSGESSFLTEDYFPDKDIPNMIKMYNAINITPGSKLTIAKPGIKETLVAVSNPSNDTLEVSTALSESFPAGSKVILEHPVQPMYNQDEIRRRIEKHASVGTYLFLESYEFKA